MPRKSWYINESELDDYQVKVIQRVTDNSFIVKGCAGSGKSILALWKAKQIQETKMGSYYVIVFTKALRQFMKDGIESINLSSEKVTYHWLWEHRLDRASADYIIVDEAQDFNKNEISALKQAAKKALILYGDSAQQIYLGLKDDLMTMEEIASFTNFPLEQLVFNHRLPKKIARVAGKISKINDDLEIRCTKEGSETPKILEYDSTDAQFDAIINIIKAKSYEDVGILFRHNAEVKKAYDYFTKKGLTVEAKYDIDRNDSKMTLNFSSENPKLMTYHSAKGLQFEAVFIPDCNSEDEVSRNSLYVAITRTYNALFIMHSGNLSSFFDSIPESLYQTTLDAHATRRL